MNAGKYSSLSEFIDAEAYIVERKQLPLSPLGYVLQNKLIRNDGLWLEFGVYTGFTLNGIASFTTNTVYGFDSFEGLPEDWKDGTNKGSYSTNGVLPEVAENVELIPGWFADSLPSFLENHPENVAFLHIDCDIYSSAKTVLTLLQTRIVAGTVIIFDELFNYPQYDQHEIKALYEFLKQTNLPYEWIGMQGQIALVPDRAYERKYYDTYRGTALKIA